MSAIIQGRNPSATVSKPPVENEVAKDSVTATVAKSCVEKFGSDGSDFEKNEMVLRTPLKKSKNVVSNARIQKM